ncbi:hypothetical protein [Streptomyces sp. CB02115]|uniref:hypothetical protein n=1 Tax=Streptomyces sp. CB02115 TaxID=1703939 RepID=UPI001A7E16DE|nr:hypothetical protein [Streptomyces sp. CB02115]
MDAQFLAALEGHKRGDPVLTGVLAAIKAHHQGRHEAEQDGPPGSGAASAVG